MILHLCTENHDHMMCCGVVMAWVGWMINGQFPDWRVLRLTLFQGQMPDWHFSDGNFLERAIPWPESYLTETSLTGYLPTMAFSRLEISLTITYFHIFELFTTLLVKANSLDFLLNISWFIILSINSICTQVIRERFNLLYCLWMFSYDFLLKVTKVDD